MKFGDDTTGGAASAQQFGSGSLDDIALSCLGKGDQIGGRPIFDPVPVGTGQIRYSFVFVTKADATLSGMAPD
jgi:hypothetical protein